MPLLPGTRLGPYEIIAPLGAGGMGEVYRARDTKLKRDVALKVLPDAFAGNPERMARFQREAEVLASLNHPNIAHVYGVEDRALVMELVEGVEPKGPMPFDEAWKIAMQVADALEYAHERGVIHRDLKPANVKVTPGGVVKLLDFGLAKAFTAQHASANPENSPTLTMDATQTGVILGTAAYMAPEQTRGKNVDKRADIWAFGVVLHELLTGQRLFNGETVADILIEVATKDPDWDRVPAEARRLLRECLHKDRKQRLKDIGDAKLLLTAETALPAARPSRRSRIVAAGLAVLFVSLAVLSGYLALRVREAASNAAIVRSTILPPENASFDVSSIGTAVLSPDGRLFVVRVTSKTGKRQLWIRSLDSLAAQPIPETDDGYSPFWSPDGRSLGFFAHSALKKIDIAGGPPVTLCEAPQGRGGTWNRDGVIVFAPNRSGPLFRVSAAGGSPSPATVLDTARKETAHSWPAFLPDGRHFLYSAGNAGGNAGSVGMIRIGSLDSNGSASKKLMESDFNAAYASGYLLYLRDATLMAAPFDLRALEIRGAAIPVAEQVRTFGIPQFHGAFSLSENGGLIYRKGNLQGVSQLAWFDRHGAQISTFAEPDHFASVELAPDQSKVGATIGTTPATSTGIWLYDVARGFATRFTSDPAHIQRAPVWSPDGKTIVFGWNRNGHFDLYEEPSDGSREAEMLYADDLEKYPSSISPDGRFLLYYTLDSPQGSNYSWVLPLTGERKPFRLTQDTLKVAEAELRPRFSPDGRWISYDSSESGRFEVYVVPFPGRGGKVRISEAGGFAARWRRDGKELFYTTLDRRLMSVEIKSAGSNISVGRESSLFGEIPAAPGDSYDVSADGQRFLVISAPQGNQDETLTLVENWPRALRR